MSEQKQGVGGRFLRGVRVIDLTNVLAGPFCCHQLAHLGAEVIKVEHPEHGDLARQLGADPALNERLMGASFLAQNAGKKSVTLNLKSTEGAKMLRRLVASSDVVVENFRPGVMDRLGLGYEALKQVNPKLVYCAISGFGQSGPLRNLPAYDQIVQGMSGVMSITGDSGSAPLRVGYPVSDTIGGLTAALAVTAAMATPETERGAFIDVPMLEATIATMGWVVSNWLVAGVQPSSNGNENTTSAPSGTFLAADGPFNIAANKDEQWVSACRALGLEELIDEPDFRTRELRKRNRLKLRDRLEERLRSRPAEDWVTMLNLVGVPAGRILSVPEVLAHPQIAASGLLEVFKAFPGVDRDVTVVGAGFKVNGGALRVDTPPPVLGEHNASVWSTLGYSREDIDRLQKDGVL